MFPSRKSLATFTLNSVLLTIIVLPLLILHLPQDFLRLIAWAIIFALAINVINFLFQSYNSKSATIVILSIITSGILTALTLFVILVFSGLNLSPEGQKTAQGTAFLFIELPFIAAAWTAIFEYMKRNYKSSGSN